MRPIKSDGPLKLEILASALFNKPTRLFCAQCEKYVPSTMPWICPFCGNLHTDVRLHSFLNKCKACKRSPEGVECPHCATVWVFSKESRGQYVARKIPPAVSTAAPAETEREKRKREHQEQKEELERQGEIRQLMNKIKELESQSAPQYAKAFQKEQDEIMQEFHKLFAAGMTIDRLRKEFTEEYKSDPNQLKRINDWLKQIEIDRA